jgi:DNA mismatch endonuclease (patch repair protein)
LEVLPDADAIMGSVYIVPSSVNTQIILLGDLIVTDTLSPSERSQRMARVKAKNTKPEMFVRRIVHAAGYRYKLHDPNLPGKPDLVFGRRRKVIFINGCFWHSHSECSLARTPKSNFDFWSNKLQRNKARDEENIQKLNELSWEVLVLWECELRNSEVLVEKIKSFLGATRVGGDQK